MEGTKKRKIKWADKITNIQANVLTKLGRYQYLTFSQMLKLEVGTTQYQYLWKQVTSLRDRRKPLVKCHNFSTPQPKMGRVESLYFLTQLGKQILIDELNIHETEIKKPNSKTVAYKDYHHRKQTIDFKINLDKWINQNDFEVNLFDTYFEKSKSGSGVFRAKTRIDLKGDYIIPDGAIKIKAEGLNSFYLFELHRGDETARLIQQVHKHAAFLTCRATHGKYALPINKGYHIILLFEHDNTKQAFLKRIGQEQEVFKNVGKYFLCKSISDMEGGSLNEGWKNLFGQERQFL